MIQSKTHPIPHEEKQVEKELQNSNIWKGRKNQGEINLRMIEVFFILSK